MSTKLIIKMQDLNLERTNAYVDLHMGPPVFIYPRFIELNQRYSYSFRLKDFEKFTENPTFFYQNLNTFTTARKTLNGKVVVRRVAEFERGLPHSVTIHQDDWKLIEEFVKTDLQNYISNLPSHKVAAVRNV